MRKVYLLLLFSGTFLFCKSQTVVISQVYGGGGNTGSIYTHDFVEIFNATGSSISLVGWSIQYAAATGTTWEVTNLSGTIAPGQYFLIQQAMGTGGTTPLPTPDASGTIAMSATAGKVALVNSTTPLTGTCPGGVIDFVGFGTSATCFEGTGPTPAPSNTNAVLRANNGCSDNNQNATDFSTSSPVPRNSSSPFNICSVNTINLTAVSSVTYNIDCFTDATGQTVTFTSTGTFNAGNNYVAQLSDAGGSFAAFISIGSIASTANSGSIPITIPAGTLTGVGYLIRIVSDNPGATSNTSAAINISLTGTCVSFATDFYRSKNSGDWNLITTWQSSVSGLAGTWINATLTPTGAANTIQIRNGHSVSITSTEAADQVVVESGGILNQASGVFTIDDGTGDDINIQNGGVFTLSFTDNPPLFGAGSPVVNINTGGILRVSAGGMTSAAPANGVNVANYVYQHQSVLEFTLNGAFVTGSNVVYFPNVDAVTIPIFRTTANFPTVLNVGAGTPTTFNGIFEAGGTATIRWQNAGNKIFRNGIRGQGNIDYEAASIASAKFVINGMTAELGGLGSLLVPPLGGLEIGTPTTVTMTSDKTVTGNISLLTDTYIDLGIYDLTVSGRVSNATITSYVRTLSTGVLTLQNVGSGFSSKLFPIGRITINPVLIGSTPAETFSARIVEPITPAIYNDNYAVLRTWYLSSAAASPPSTNLTFGYTYPADCGTSFVNLGANAQVGVNIGGTWNIHQSGLTPVPFLIPGTSTVTPTNPFNSFTTGSEFPFVVANNGAILTIDCIITAQSKKINNTGLISWDVSSCSEVGSFEVQRSLAGGAFQTIGRITPGTDLRYNFTDMALAGGTNLYRIKINGISGAFKYSNTVAIINDTKGLLITALSPNPVTDNATLVINAANAATVSFTIFSISGQPLKQWQAPVIEGSNNISIATTGLLAGIYHLAASSADAKTVMRFVKQ